MVRGTNTSTDPNKSTNSRNAPVLTRTYRSIVVLFSILLTNRNAKAEPPWALASPILLKLIPGKSIFVSRGIESKLIDLSLGSRRKKSIVSLRPLKVLGEFATALGTRSTPMIKMLTGREIRDVKVVDEIWLNPVASRT